MDSNTITMLVSSEGFLFKMKREEQKELNDIYKIRKQIVTAMEANGRCSREAANRQRQAIDFAITRINIEANLAALTESRIPGFIKTLFELAAFMTVWTLTFHFG